MEYQRSEVRSRCALRYALAGLATTTSIVLGLTAAHGAVPKPPVASTVLKASDLLENFEYLEELSSANATDIDELEVVAGKLTCGGDSTRMLAGAAACKASSPSTSTFVACAENGDYPQDVCAATLPGSVVANRWQFNTYSCSDPNMPCIDYALGPGTGTGNAVVGSNYAVICCAH